jgi:uncharacterized SAM-binding protein YcdF (DUF218 family)
MSGSMLLRLLGFGAVLLFLAAGFTPLPNALNRWAHVPAQVEPAAAVVVLGAGLSAAGVLSEASLRRALYGIKLYHQGLAPLLAFSGPAYEFSPEESRIRADLAGLFGVPPAAIVTEAAARTTREEAARFAALLQPMGVRQILLVTSDEHMLRSRQLFERAGFTVLPAPVDDLSHPRKPEARLRLMRRVTQEFLARAHYWVAGYL